MSVTSESCVQNFDPWLSHPVRIAGITREIPGVCTLNLQFEDSRLASTWSFRPGQFTMLYVPGAGEAAISISGDPGVSSVITQTIRDAGNVTRSITGLGEGAVIGLRGPFGSCWPVEMCRGRDVVLIAGGIGLAPLRPVILQLLRQRDQDQELTLIVGAREPSLLLYPDQYDAWRRQGLNVIQTVDRADDSWTGGIGVVTAVLDRIGLRNAAETVVMTCGPEVMMTYAIKTALSRGIPRELLFLSMERNMNCAVALCGHCQFGPHFLCREGPVFSYRHLRPLMRIDDL